jgi:hypothetical protein
MVTTAIVQPFENMDMWEQQAHLLARHKVNPGPPQLDAWTGKHDRRHAVDLDLDHSHEEARPR